MTAALELPSHWAACAACAAAWESAASGLMHARCLSCRARALADSAPMFGCMSTRDHAGMQSLAQQAFDPAELEVARSLAGLWLRRRRELRSKTVVLETP